MNEQSVLARLKRWLATGDEQALAEGLRWLESWVVIPPGIAGALGRVDAEALRTEVIEELLTGEEPRLLTAPSPRALLRIAVKNRWRDSDRAHVRGAVIRLVVGRSEARATGADALPVVFPALDPLHHPATGPQGALAQAVRELLQHEVPPLAPAVQMLEHMLGQRPSLAQREDVFGRPGVWRVHGFPSCSETSSAPNARRSFS
jgi:hypothetical protein